MELVKNKASGKFFIVLDESGENYLHLITPEGRIKHLERRLFSLMIPVDNNGPKTEENLTPAQMNTYMEYLEYGD